MKDGAPRRRKPRTTRNPTVVRLLQTRRIGQPEVVAAMRYKSDAADTGASADARARLCQVHARLSKEARQIVDAVVLRGETCVRVRVELMKDINIVLPAIGDALQDLAAAYGTVAELQPVA